MNGRPKAVYEDTLTALKANKRMERRHLRRKTWRLLRVAFGWVTVAGVVGLAWHEILGGLGRLIGRR